MASEFGKVLKTLIYQRHDSARAFVRAVGGFSSEDAGVARVSKVMAGKLPPPLDRLNAWADALKCSDDERRKLWYLASIAHVPALARPYLEQIYARIEQLEKRAPL